MHFNAFVRKQRQQLGKQNVLLTAIVIVLKFNHLFTLFFFFCGGCNYVVSHLKSSY